MALLYYLGLLIAVGAALFFLLERSTFGMLVRAAGFAVDHGGLQAEHAFIKGAVAGSIGRHGGEMVDSGELHDRLRLA